MYIVDDIKKDTRIHSADSKNAHFNRWIETDLYF